MTLSQESVEGIAIIGMSGRFPKAKDIDQFWQNLRDGVASMTYLDEQKLASMGMDPAILDVPGYVNVAYVLEDTDLFDAPFFGYSTKEAELLDPQQRVFLEEAWKTFENAGYDPISYKGSVGLYAGASMNTYLINLYSRCSIGDMAEASADIETMIGSDTDYLTTRVSYKLNLKGPSVGVQTACSTSLVAVYMACQGLLNYQCDMALSGGISIFIGQGGGYLYRKGEILSPDGYCRAFDAKAGGTVGGSGSGIVLLKRLEDAVKDGDHIYAVIRGSAINNDGSLKVGYTAPSVEGQAEVIAMAQALAGVPPETIRYIEAHGTGTHLGDPIEIAALTRVFRAHTRKKGFCAVGSVKTNIGHLDAAAGVAGLIKAALAIEHKQIPPSLHFEKPNPEIDFENSPFYVNAKLNEWKKDEWPRRAGVSSFGIGGTNAHVVLEEAPTVRPSDKGRPWQLIVLSAKTESALETAGLNLASHFKAHPDLNFADAAYTLKVGRRAFGYRKIVVCRDALEAISLLEGKDAKRTFISYQEAKTHSITFMFPGQGSQYVDMGLELYKTESVFREQVDRCCQILKSHMSLDMSQVIYPPEADRKKAGEQLKQTMIAQSALFVIEYALAKLWIAWGITPQSMIGQDVGEYVAATLAGVFKLEDALELVANQERTIHKTISLSAPNIPYISSVTGTWVRPEEATDTAYWSKHMRQSVRFADGVKELIQDQDKILLEVGPGDALCTLAKAQSEKNTNLVVLTSMRHPSIKDSDNAFLMTTLGRLWLAGTKVDWVGFHAREHRMRVVLPTYPFQRQSYQMISPELPDSSPQSLLEKKSEFEGWFYFPAWKRSFIPCLSKDAQTDKRSCWLVFTPEAGPGVKIAAQLKDGGDEVITVNPGASFRRMEDGSYTLNPKERGDYQRLMKDIKVRERRPDKILHMWCLSPYHDVTSELERFQECQELGLYSLLYLAQAIDKENITYPIRFWVVTHNTQEVTGEEGLTPDQSTVHGASRVIAQEYPHLTFGSIDIVLPGSGTEQEKRLVRQLITEIQSENVAPMVAYRGSHRWLQHFEKIPLLQDGSGLLKERGVYMITGGLGGIGMVLAEYLTKSVHARLVLTGRSPFPEKDQWDAWISSHDEEDTVSRKIQVIKRLEQAGAEVLILCANVSDEKKMQSAIGIACERFGRIDGVFHGAGATGENWFRPVNETGPDHCEGHFRPKVYGLHVLEKVFQNREPDFCLLFSSLSSVLGGLGFVAYAAANSYMDGYASWHNKRSSVPWISVNWDGWTFGKNLDGASSLAITTEEGAKAFERILKIAPIDQVLVSARDLQARIDHWVIHEVNREEKRKASSATQLHPRPELRSSYAEPENELEEKIVKMWQEVLGIEKVGVHDNFFELGGNSLMGFQLNARIREALGVELPTHKVFEAPTVAELVDAIAQKVISETDSEALAGLLPEIEKLQEGEN